MGTPCWFPGPIQSPVKQNTCPKIRRPNRGPRKNNNLKGNEVRRQGLQQPLAFHLCGTVGEKCHIHSLESTHSQVLRKPVANLQETYDNCPLPSPRVRRCVQLSGPFQQAGVPIVTLVNESLKLVTKRSTENIIYPIQCITKCQ